LWFECVGDVAVIEEVTGDRKRLRVVSLSMVSLSVVSLRVVSLSLVSLRVLTLSVVSLSLVSLGVVSLMSLRVVSLAVVSLRVLSLSLISLRVVSLRVVAHLQDPGLKEGGRYVSMMRTLSVFVLTLVGERIVNVEVHDPCPHILHNELASACVATQGSVWRRMVVLHPGTKDYDHSGQVPTYSRIHGVGTATMSTACRH
jgi:hypothetical protein